MIGYKATNKDGCCRGFKFEVGKTYTKDTKKEEMKCCTDKVFHFCRELQACFNYYDKDDCRLFEIITGDYVKDGDKYGTNSITILRELTEEDKKNYLNSGNCNSGDCNSGNYNSGDCNSGNWNSGDWNSGDCNSGNYNSGNYNSGNYNSGNRNNGDYNSGDWNSGDYNSGNRNSGNYNSGNRNSGDWNSGDYNSGDYNSGDWNSGDWNSGDCNSGNYNSGNYNSGNYNSGNRNSGNWNSGDYNSGYFNSNEPAIRMFNKNTRVKMNDIKIPSWCYFNLTTWVTQDTATDKEKEVYKTEINTSGGFLKTLDYKEAWKNAYDKTSDEEKKELFELPNYNCKVFKEITGIDTRADYKRLTK